MPKNLLLFVIVTKLIFAFLPALFTATHTIQDYSLNRWDAPHYLYIADHGYTNVGDERNFIVFQPFYPFIIRLVTLVGLNSTTTAQLISIITATLGSLIFYKLIKMDYREKVAALSVIVISIFPTSYFFSAPYTEGLFFLLSVLALYLGRKHNWLWAGIAAGLALLTKHVGVFLVIPLFIEWLQSKDKKIISPVLFTLPIGLAGLVYLGINDAILGDPFAFQKILHEHWFKTFIPFWTSLKGTWQTALGGSDRYNLEIGWWEAIPATVSLILIPFIWKTLRKSYAAYYTAYVLFILSTSFLLSTARYLLSIPPLFIFLGIISQKSKLFFVIWSTLSVFLLMYFAKTFVSGGWAF
jgi:4-amino-4-deoxy-L-arabinose transferase-like glycosyltransferase